MAAKKFHITPDGPKKCTASFRGCPYQDHFQTEQSAFAAEKLISDNTMARDKLIKLREFIQRPDQRYLSRSGFLFDNRYDAPRRFAEELENRKKEFGIKPELYHSTASWSLTNRDGDQPIEVQVMRTDHLDEQQGEIIGKWRITTKTTLGYYQNFEKISQETMIDFNDEFAAKRSFLQAHEAFRNAAVMSGIRDDDEADAKAEEMSAQLTTMVNAIESNAAGDFEAWERGYGYFQESDGETIIVKEDFNTSAFRGENFKSFLNNNYYYTRYTPVADITITDTSRRTGATWTLQKSGGDWSVIEVTAAGETKVSHCKTAQEVYNAVYWAVKDDDAEGQDDVARRKGKYVGELAWEIDNALTNHAKTVSERLENERLDKEAKDNKKVNNDLYDRDQEEKGSIIGRIFDSFT